MSDFCRTPQASFYAGIHLCMASLPLKTLRSFFIKSCQLACFIALDTHCAMNVRNMEVEVRWHLFFTVKQDWNYVLEYAS